MTPTSLAAYLVLFLAAGFVFVFVALLVGRLVRAWEPHGQKLDTYECGEPPVGSSAVQFDLRFYVVALVFLVFDVEVAFFFPWATVYGKAVHLMDRRLPKTMADGAGPGSPAAGLALSHEAQTKLRELGVRQPGLPDAQHDANVNARLIEATAGRLARMALCEMALFFAVLLVGYAYVWSQGDLGWVRAVAEPDGGDANGADLAAGWPSSVRAAESL